MSRNSFRATLAATAALLAIGCDDGVGPSRSESIALAPQSHSIQVGEAYTLTATFTDPNGRLEPSAIRWQSLEAEVATVTPAGVVTGVRPGSARIVASAGGASDTTRIRVLQTAASVSVDPLPALAPGEEAQLSAIVLDTEGDEMATPVTWSAAPAEVASIDAEGRLTALSVGDAVITASVLPAQAEMTVQVRDIPPPIGCGTESIRLGVGETRSFDGGTALSLCLSGGAEYTLVAANASSSSAIADFRGSGLSAPAAVASAGAVTARTLSTSAVNPARLDREFERNLRRREREQLSPAGARSRVTSRSLQVTPTARAVGDLMDLSTSSDCDAPEMSTGRVQYVGERSIVVADTANPAGMSPQDYARFGALYDTLLYPVVTEHFGEPAGFNDETRVVIYYTRAVNELTEAGSDGVVGGYFWAGDLFPRSSCAGSNEREMFYMLAPDPQGAVNGNVRPVEYVERVTAGTIAHELQHLINASRRLFINDAQDWEEPWMNEGLSHIAEELVFHRRSGLTSRKNLGPSQLGSTSAQLDAANRYAISNLLRMDRYVRETERQGPFQGDDDLATRGASWQFLRYAIDRHGGDARILLGDLVDSKISGLDNFAAVFGADPREWFVDDAVGIYADDHVSGTSAVHQHPSWNFRTLFDWINDDGFVLRTRELRDAEARSVRLEGWGSGYIRTAVAAGRIGNLQVGTAAAPPAETLKFVLMRTR